MESTVHHLSLYYSASSRIVIVAESKADPSEVNRGCNFITTIAIRHIMAPTSGDKRIRGSDIGVCIAVQEVAREFPRWYLINNAYDATIEEHSDWIAIANIIYTNRSIKLQFT